MLARGNHNRNPLRDQLLAELLPRQPLLALINVVTAFLFVSGVVDAAPTTVLATWIGYMVLSQVVRLLCWRRQAIGRPLCDAAVWLVATSGAAGIGWGVIGPLFDSVGSSAQRTLVPFFLAGMAAGAVANLAGDLPVLYAFLIPALLPYAVHLALTGTPVAHTMALTILAYAVGLSAVAYQVHRSLRRSTQLHLENSATVGPPSLKPGLIQLVKGTPMLAGGNHGRNPLRDQLLAELLPRQPLLALINVVTAFLFVSGVVDAAPTTVLAAWIGYMMLSQAARLLFWRRQAIGRPLCGAAGWLVATSMAAGLGWGMTGPLFATVGSPAQRMLVPFFLAGMVAGAVANLAGDLPVLYAFLVPALLPYAVRLALTGTPAAHTMALTILAYAAGLSAVAYQVHRSLRRSAQLHLENADLVADLQRARCGLEQLVERRGAELDAVMETVPVAVWLAHDPEAKRITGNRRAAEMLRLKPRNAEALIAPEGKWPEHINVLKEGEEVPAEDMPLRRAARGEPVQGEELRVVFDDETFFDMLISAATVRDAVGKPTGAVGAAMDITERKRAEERVKHMAHHDQLTGLPNRILLHDRLQQALALAHPDGPQLGLLLLDLDHFKDLNDTLGHPAGDWLLRAAAERFREAIRRGDTLARLGGDEFAVVQPSLEGPEGAAALAQRLIDTLAEPFVLEAQEVHVSASVGIALFKGDRAHADELIRKADLALYRAKREGRGRFSAFEPSMDAEVQVRGRLERELRAALDKGEFVLHYQPLVDLSTDRVDSVEALVRWCHPERGLVLPGEFIPAAEASGLIRPLGAWVLGEACRQARVWRDAGLELMMGVNLSPAQLRHDGLLHEVDGALRANGLDPRWLELEITESLFLERSEDTTDFALRGLAARGIRLALDDFGTGYSSLALLRRLPVAKIKIDRSFVRDIGCDPEDEAVLRAMVSLGHALGRQVVAEGVENEVQLAFLRRLGCDAAQGFLFARPQAPNELGSLLKHRMSIRVQS